MNERPDIDRVYADAAEWFIALVDGVPPGAWEHPGLGDWDMRALVGHTGRALSTLNRALGSPATHIECATAEEYVLRTATLASNADGDSVFARGVDAGRDLGAQPSEAVRGLVRAAISALAEARTPIAPRSGGSDAGEAIPDPIVTTIVGGMPLSEYLRTRVFELVVHGQDLVRARRRVDRALTTASDAPPADALREAAGMAGRIALERGDGERLLRALTGRSGLPDGYSVLTPVSGRGAP